MALWVASAGAWLRLWKTMEGLELPPLSKLSSELQKKKLINKKEMYTLKKRQLNMNSLDIYNTHLFIFFVQVKIDLRFVNTEPHLS